MFCSANCTCRFYSFIRWSDGKVVAFYCSRRVWAFSTGCPYSFLCDEQKSVKSVVVFGCCLQKSFEYLLAMLRQTIFAFALIKRNKTPGYLSFKAQRMLVVHMLCGLVCAKFFASCISKPINVHNTQNTLNRRSEIYLLGNLLDNWQLREY